MRLFLGAGLLIGVGVAAAIVAGPTLLRVARPALREGFKRGGSFYARARTVAASAVEDLEDLVAEVRADQRNAPGAEKAGTS